MSEPASPRDELVTLLTSPQHAPMNDHHPETGGCMSCPWPMHMLPPEEIADVLIAAGYRHIPTLNLLHEDDTREKKTCDKAVKIQAVDHVAEG